jgi:hydroxyacylglutathione hydrolase
MNFIPGFSNRFIAAEVLLYLPVSGVQGLICLTHPRFSAIKPGMEHPLDITILPAFGDNYIYLAEYARGMCLVVDPGDAGPVLKELKRRDLQLTHMFATHHHADHIGGVASLKKQFGCEVVGPDAKRIAGLDTVVSDGDGIELGDVTIRCIAAPGHTATSVCYYVTAASLAQPVLFTGDTLFVCGCGRMFECGGETMYASLQKLAALADQTLVYPGHDYTEENVRFALTFEPDNEALKKKLDEVREKTATHKPTVPSTLAEEKKLNPFLKAPDWQTFARLRKQKDSF